MKKRTVLHLKRLVDKLFAEDDDAKKVLIRLGFLTRQGQTKKFYRVTEFKKLNIYYCNKLNNGKN